ncbi:unnamed protein product [Phyllotreta striolata]|nr:unnamed protein product [Phyllotreta striolata]
MEKLTVLITNPTVPIVAIKEMEEKGYNIKIVNKEDRAEILQKLPGTHGLWWASQLKLDKEILDAAGPQLKMIGVMSAGYNHVSLDELKKRGIKASNTPNVLNDAVADVAVLLSLAAGRRMTEARWAIENNQWVNNEWKWMVGQDVRNSTIGIIGLGGIGFTTARRFKGFDVKDILYTGHKEKKEAAELGYKFVDLDALLAASDFVIVAVPLTAETQGFCDAAFFKKMKKNAVFVNISRGPVVDQPALINALKTGEIFAAGLDVMTPEPLPPDHELLKMPNVVVLPHIASATNHTRDGMAILTMQNLHRGLTGQPLLTPIFVFEQQTAVGRCANEIASCFIYRAFRKLAVMEKQRARARRCECGRMRKNVSMHFKEYCRSSSMHGFKYFGEDRTLVEKIWWVVCITSCILFCGTMLYKIFLKYSYFPVIVTFSMKESRLQRLPFPAVTICPRARVSQKYFNFTEYFYKELNSVPTTAYENKIRDMSATICDFYPSNSTEKIDENEFKEFLNESQTDIFYYCQYLNVEYLPCKELFTPILTEDGICYSFNILDKGDIYRENVDLLFEDFHKAPPSIWNVETGFLSKNVSTYPRRALRIGIRNQLMVILKTKFKDVEFQCAGDDSGYRVSVHLPSDVPEVPENHFYAPLGQRVVSAIVPHTIRTSEGVKNFSPAKRDCYFESEKRLKFFKLYSHANCMIECKANYTLNECGCVAFHMPREAGTPVCFLDKLDCIEVALDIFSIFNEDKTSSNDEETYASQSCDCKPTCTDVSYSVDLSTNNIIFEILNKTLRDDIDFDNNAFTTLSFYFKNDHVETKERNEIYGFSDVISNFGGLLGLFTGFSILSFLEILYFLSLRIWGNIRIYGTWIKPNNLEERSAEETSK